MAAATVIIAALLALQLDARLHYAGAQTATVTAATGQSCAGTRFGSNLLCTANDFSSNLIFDQPSAGALASCIAGQTVSINVIAQITSNSPVRYDGAYFIGEVGNSPQVNDASKSCSLGVFATTPLPFENLDSDTCGDYQASQSSTLRINNVAVKCSPATGTNLLAIPYVLVFNNQDGGSTCNASNITANTKSKCISSVTATVTGVSVNGYITLTKQTQPDGHSQSFSFTGIESGGGTVTPSSFNLTDGQSQTVQVPFTSTGGGRTLTLTESSVTGWDPTSSITCTAPDGSSSSSYVAVNNANRTITATLSTTNYGALCTITNTKIPTVAVQKKTTGGTSGPFSFAQTNLASTPADITTSAIGSATPASPTAINVSTLSTAVTLAETLASNYRLTSASCTDSQSALTGNTGSIGTVSGTTLTIPGANVKPGSVYNCLFTNAKIPVVKVQKITTGAPGGSFTFTQTNLASTPSGITTIAAGTATPSSPSAINVTTIGSDVTLAETVVSGYTLLSASCTDANSAVTGNTGSIGSVSGTTLTIPAASVVAGADFTCLFTNRKTPTVKVQKITTGGFGGAFTFTQTNLASAPSGITTAAAGTATPASPTAISVSTVGTAVTLTETSATGFFFTTASCTDANSAITGNSGSIGTVSGTTLTIPAVKMVAGADFTCVFANTKATPQLTVAKSASIASANAAGTAITYTLTVSNSGNVPVTAITVSDPRGAVTCATSGAATIASLAPAATETCSLTYTITQADLDNNGGGDGDIDNTATASGSYGAVTVQGSGSATVLLVVTPGLSVTKTADDTTDVLAGQTLAYTYVVTNTGNQTISNVALADSHNASGPAPLPRLETLTTDASTTGDSTDATSNNGVWSVLAPGDAITFTGTYIVKQQDVDTLQ